MKMRLTHIYIRYVRGVHILHQVCQRSTLLTSGMSKVNITYIRYVRGVHYLHQVCQRRTLLTSGMSEAYITYIRYVRGVHYLHQVCQRRTLLTSGMSEAYITYIRYVRGIHYLHQVCQRRTLLTSGISCHNNVCNLSWAESLTPHHLAASNLRQSFPRQIASHCFRREFGSSSWDKQSEMTLLWRHTS